MAAKESSMPSATWSCKWTTDVRIKLGTTRRGLESIFQVLEPIAEGTREHIPGVGTNRRGRLAAWLLNEPLVWCVRVLVAVKQGAGGPIKTKSRVVFMQDHGIENYWHLGCEADAVDGHGVLLPHLLLHQVLHRRPVVQVAVADQVDSVRLDGRARRRPCAHRGMARVPPRHLNRARALTNPSKYY
eukprot:3030220-Pyramimonas_sp.AAC.1